MGSLTSLADHNSEDVGDGTYGLSPLSEKTRTSNHLQMSLQIVPVVRPSTNWANWSAVELTINSVFHLCSSLKYFLLHILNLLFISSRNASKR